MAAMPRTGTMDAKMMIGSSRAIYAALFNDLLDSGKNISYDSMKDTMNNPSPQDDGAFCWELDVPEMEYSPFHEDLDYKSMCDILGNDAQESDGERLTYFPPNGDATADKAAATNLIGNLSNLSFTCDGYVASLSSSLLDEMGKPRKRHLPDSILETDISFSVLPNSHLLDLQHQSESTGYANLLTGVIVWMIWPPTEQNMSTLAAGYEAFAADCNTAKLNLVAKDLVGGVSLVQREGDEIRIPPFCPMIALTLETSVIASHKVMTTKSFINALERIPFYITWFQTEMEGKQKLHAFREGLVGCFTNILNREHADIPQKEFRWPIKEESPLGAALKAWDTVKANVYALLTAHQRDRIKELWVKVLSSSSSQRCLVCGQRCRSGPSARWKPGQDIITATQALERHFNVYHWFGDGIQ